MEIEEAAKQELIDSILKTLVTPNVKEERHSDSDIALYDKFICTVNSNKKVTVQLPLEFALKDEMFNLIKSGKVFVSNSVKFVTTFTTVKPVDFINPTYYARYSGNEFSYSFLDNHPGIINIDRLKDIPIDYEGLMAVPPTVLEYKHLNKFNLHRVIYAPIYNRKLIYRRVVVSNKLATV